MSIYGIHRNEKYWKDPLKFDPDRFLVEEAEKRPPNAFIPFSTAPRNCIGNETCTAFLSVLLLDFLRSLLNIFLEFLNISSYILSLCKFAKILIEYILEGFWVNLLNRTFIFRLQICDDIISNKCSFIRTKI